MAFRARVYSRALSKGCKLGSRLRGCLVTVPGASSADEPGRVRAFIFYKVFSSALHRQEETFYIPFRSQNDTAMSMKFYEKVWMKFKNIWRTWVLQGCKLLASLACRVRARSLQTKLQFNSISEHSQSSPPPQVKMAPAGSTKLQEAQKQVKTDPSKAEHTFKEIISKSPSATSDAAVREYETALVSLGELYRDEK